MTGRSHAGLEPAQKDLGKDALVVSSDARSLTDIDALASRVKAEFDTFDLLFVNAGFSIRAPLDEQFPSKEGAAEARKQITSMTPLNRLGQPEEIAAAALFLASDESSFVAGIDLAVDGGLTEV